MATTGFPDLEKNSAKEAIEQLIGAERAKVYEDIFPILVLIYYRSINEPLYGTQRLFDFDVRKWGRDSFREVYFRTQATIVYRLLQLRWLGKPHQEPKVLLSNTFLRSRRYPAIYKEIDENYGYKAVVSVCDIAQEQLKKNFLRGIAGALQVKYSSDHPVFVGYNVAGCRLQRAAANWLNYLVKEEKSDVRTDYLLAELQKAYKARLHKLERILQKHSIRFYMTVNQYNLRDVILLHACQRVGIKTIQVEHHAMQFTGRNFSFTNRNYRLSFAQNYAIWSQSDLEFHHRTLIYDNILANAPTRFMVAGNPEISYEAAVKFSQKYPIRRVLTFMTAAREPDDLIDPKKWQEIAQWRMSIFHALKQLSDRQNIAIRIRYTPFQEMDFREVEREQLLSYGFEISESVPGNYFEDICSSMAIMSSTSSVLATSRLFNRLTFRVEDPDLTYLSVDPEIIDIRVDEIPEISLPSDLPSPKICKNDFFDFSKILAWMG